MSLNTNSPSSSALSDAIPQRLVIRASAGTGKTFQLSSRYLSILRQSSAEKILASTFTKKAAGEIIERILLRLAKAVQSDQELQLLRSSVGGTPLTREECLELLSRLTRQLHRVRVSTLDSFFSQLATSYALELGLPPGWRVLDDLEIQQIREAAIDEMLSTGAPQDLVQLMHLLDKGQSTRSISRLILDTIENLYYVFLAAPEESWEQFPECTFLSNERRLQLQMIIEELPLDKVSLQKARAGDVEAMKNEDWEHFMDKGLMPKVASGEMKYSRTPIPEELREPYEELFTHVIASVVTPWKNQTMAARQLLRDYNTSFEQMKHSAGGLEFADVTRRLAKAQQHSRLVDNSFRLDAAIDHLLLDEFQDTSPDQWVVLRSFAEEACRTAGHSFFCVGDVKQAIYGWRGGEAELFDLITQQLPGDFSSSSSLSRSYRSSPVIMNVVNQVMTKLYLHDNLEDHDTVIQNWVERFPLHETARTELNGYVCLKTLSDAPKRTTYQGPESAADSDDDDEETVEYWAEVAQYIRDRHLEAPWATIGVLTKRNVSIGRLIFELNQLGIDASEEGGNPLTDSAVVQLILSLMTLADHPGDRVAAFHVAASPLGAIYEWSDYESGHARVRFAERLRRQLVELGYGGVIHHLVPQLQPFCSRREYQRLLQLTDFADRYDTLLADLRPGNFVSYILKQRRQEPSSAKVRVMNIHQSKGLEFDIVILPELEQKLYLPPKFVTSRPAAGMPPDVVALYRNQKTFEAVGGPLLKARKETLDRLFQESLCLLYVAITRSVRSLHLLMRSKEAKKHAKSFAGMLKASLAPDVPFQPYTTLWEAGEPDWFQDESLRLAPELMAAAAESENNDENLPRHIQFAQKPGKRPLRMLSPSLAKASSQILLGEELRERSSAAAERGTLFHSWFEQVTWLDQAEQNLDHLRSLGRQQGFVDDDVEQNLGQFLAMLQAEWCENLLSKACYRSGGHHFDRDLEQLIASGTAELEVRNELPFTMRENEEGIISGTIDRLVLVKRGTQVIAAEVIDFKTDAIVEDMAAQSQKYEQQLAWYRHAVTKLFGLPDDRVFTVLAFVSGGIVSK